MVCRAAREHGNEVEYDKAKEIVYNMPYSEWKQKVSKIITFYNL